MERVEMLHLSPPNEKQKLFLQCRKKYIAFGGARGGGKRYKKFTKKRRRGFSGSAVCAIMVCGFLRHSSEWLDYTEKEPIL